MKRTVAFLMFILACSLIPLELQSPQSSSFVTSVNEAVSETSARSNNPPTINSLELHNTGDLILGQVEPLNMSVQASDIDDATGDSLEYSWTVMGNTLPGCGGLGDVGTHCSTPILNSCVTHCPVMVTVTDEENESVSEELMLTIWNNASVSSTSDAGITVSYAINYFGSSAFSITSTDADLLSYENKELPGYSGTYSAVGAVDYTPSTTYSANDVLSQSMSVSAPKDLGAASLWYITNEGIWTLITADSVDVDTTTVMFEYSFPTDSPVLSAGVLVLMGNPLPQAEVPNASITGFSASAAKGGAISLNWGIDGIMLNSESIGITICEDQEGCLFDEYIENSYTSYTYSGQNTVHGVEYTITVAVCNEVGCSSPVGTGTVVADSAVDGGAAATDLTISASGNTWTVSWTASGDQADVASWRVCYQRGFFTAAGIGDTTCLYAQGTTLDVNISTWAAGTYSYYFTAVPVDALGNSVDAGAMNHIDYQRDADNSNDDGTNLIEDSDGDGVADDIDMFPFDSSETNDSDGDGFGDNSDAFPFDADEFSDLDGDGVGDNSDAFPFDADETHDSDGDGVGDNSDIFPNDMNESKDGDGDGVGDYSDDCVGISGNSTQDLLGCRDNDGDGWSNANDAFINNSQEWEDSDKDGVGDNSDVFPYDNTESKDSDGNGIGDNEQLKSEQRTRTYATISIISLLFIGGSLAGVFYFKKEIPNVPQKEPIEISDVLNIETKSQQPAVNSVESQWTDETGYTWRKMSDGSTHWWDGTHWKPYDKQQTQFYRKVLVPGFEPGSKE